MKERLIHDFKGLTRGGRPLSRGYGSAPVAGNFHCSAFEQQYGGNYTADLNHKHDGIPHHLARVQLEQGIPHRPLDDFPFPDSFFPGFHWRVSEANPVR